MVTIKLYVPKRIKTHEKKNINFINSIVKGLETNISEGFLLV